MINVSAGLPGLLQADRVAPAVRAGGVPSMLCAPCSHIPALIDSLQHSASPINPSSAAAVGLDFNGHEHVNTPCLVLWCQQLLSSSQ